MTVVIEHPSAIACAGAFLAFLDTTIVNIAFPDIAASFSGSGRDALSWVLDGYFVVIAALLVPAGGLADRFGHRRIFLLGLAGFTAASLLCAVAPSLELLIAFRVLQGIGAAMIAPTSLAIVLDSFPIERRATGLGHLGRGGRRGGGDRADPRRRARRARRLAPRLPRQPAARRRDPARRPPQPGRAAESATAACPTCPGRRCWRSAWPLITLAIVEGNDWGWTAAATLGCFAAGRACSPASSCAAGATRARSSSPSSSPTARSGSATSAPCSSPPPSSR